MRPDGPDTRAGVRVLRTADEFLRIADEWDALSSRSRSPILQADWVATCLRTCSGGPARPAIVTIRRRGRLVAGAPLEVARRKGVAVLQIPGAELLGEPSDLIAVDRASLHALMQAVLALRTPVRLRRLAADGDAHHVLTRLPRHMAATRVTSSAPYPFLPLSGSVDSLVSSSLRSDLRRARRRAEGLGRVEYRMSAPTPSTALPELRAAMTVEAAGWKSASGTALRVDPPRRRFFEQYAHRAAVRGSLRIATLSIGGNAAAVQIAVESNGGYWLLKIGYDERYARASPGQLLMLESLRAASDRGLASFEMLGSSADWTRRWCATERGTVDWAVYPWSARTATLVGATLMGRASRSVGLRVRRPVAAGGG